MNKYLTLFIKNILLRYSIYFLIVSLFYEFDFVNKCFEFLDKFHIYTIWSVLIFLIILSVVIAIKEATKHFFLYVWKNFVPVFIITVVLFIQRDLCFWKMALYVFVSDLLYIIITKVIKFFNRRREHEKNIIILNDNAKEKQTQDTLGREEIVDNLIKLILSIEQKESYAFLLSGGWGEGKTSCINFIKTMLEKDKKYKEYKNNFEFIKINPWFNDTKEKLLNAILGEINYFAKTNFPYKSFESEFDDIIKLSNVKLNNYVEIALQNVLENFTEDKNIQHKIEHIGKILKEEYQKKIVIILDDIDRLNKDNILFILQIVEMFKQYTNIIFILSGDYNKIEQILCETSEPCVQEKETNNKEIKKTVYYKNYIEKILNVVKLPKIVESKIEQELLFYINKILGKEKEISKERLNIYIESSRFKTLRDVKRFCNAFQISYLQVKDKINIYNFINLEILFVFYPEIYKDCLNNKEMWFKDLVVVKLNEEIEKEANEKLDKYFNNLIRNYNSQDKDILLRLISIVMVSNYNFGLQINKTKNYDGSYSYFNDKSLVNLYFTHKFPVSYIDEETIENKFIEWLKIELDDDKLNESIKIYLNTLDDKKIESFFNNIQYSKIYIKIYKVLIENFAELSDKFIGITADFIWTQIRELLKTYEEKAFFYRTIITKSTNIVFAIELYQKFIYKSFQVKVENEKDKKELSDFDITISNELDNKISNTKEKSIEQIYKIGSFDYINCWLFNKYSYAEQKNKNRDVISLAEEHRKEYKDFRNRVDNIKSLITSKKEYFRFFISDSFRENLETYNNSSKFSIEPTIPTITWYIDIWGKKWLVEQINFFFEDDLKFIELLKILDFDPSLSSAIKEHADKLKKIDNLIDWEKTTK